MIRPDLASSETQSFLTVDGVLWRRDCEGRFLEYCLVNSGQPGVVDKGHYLLMMGRVTSDKPLL